MSNISRYYFDLSIPQVLSSWCKLQFIQWKYVPHALRADVQNCNSIPRFSPSWRERLDWDCRLFVLLTRFVILFADRLNSDSATVAQNSDVIIEGCNLNDNGETNKKEDSDSACHSRNSSSASHLSKMSHSRQSSSGESASGHIRYVKKISGHGWLPFDTATIYQLFYYWNTNYQLAEVNFCHATYRVGNDIRKWPRRYQII